MRIQVRSPLVRLLAVVLASSCAPASSPPARHDLVVPAATATTNWYVTAALPRQQISRTSAGLAIGARGWATLTGAGATLFYPLTPAPEDRDLLVVGSPLDDERVMTSNGRFLGVLAQDCTPTSKR